MLSHSSRTERLCHATGAVLMVSGLAHLVVFAVASFRYRPSGPTGTPLALRSGFAILLVAPECRRP